MGMLAGVVLLVVAVGLLAYVVALYNRLVFLKNQCDKSWGNIDVLLKQRHDEIPKLVAVCEGSAQFERTTLEKVIQARAAAVGAAGVPDRARAEGELSAALNRLLAVAENYPDLKTTQMFSQLQGRISQLESEIADRREFYNDAVMNNNTTVESVPYNILAGFFGMRIKDLFTVAAADKADVEVKFNLPK
jgi:LemA protein